MMDRVDKKLRAESSRTTAKKLGMDLVAFLVALIFLFPLYWILISSFKTDVEIFDKNISFWPRNFSFSPWVTQLNDNDFLFSLRNSFIIAASNMVLSTVLGCTAAYGLARFKTPGKRIIILVFLVTQMMPGSLLLTPLYLMFTKAGLLNSYPAPVMAIATGSIPFIVVIMRPFFLSLPKSLDEAARIDGATRSPPYAHHASHRPRRTSDPHGILLPARMERPYLLYDVQCQGSHAAFTANIYKFMDKYGTKWNQIMAYGTILVIPVLIVFVGLQKYIIGGLTSGAVKE